MPQETSEDVHALCRPLEAFGSTGCRKINVVQFRQLIDIRLRENGGQIFLPRAQRLASTRYDRKRTWCIVIGSGNSSVLEGAGKPVRKCLLRCRRQNICQPAYGTIRTQNGK